MMNYSPQSCGASLPALERVCQRAGIQSTKPAREDRPWLARRASPGKFPRSGLGGDDSLRPGLRRREATRRGRDRDATGTRRERAAPMSKVSIMARLISMVLTAVGGGGDCERSLTRRVCSSRLQTTPTRYASPLRLLSPSDYAYLCLVVTTTPTITTHPHYAYSRFLVTTTPIVATHPYYAY